MNNDDFERFSVNADKYIKRLSPKGQMNADFMTDECEKAAMPIIKFLDTVKSISNKEIHRHFMAIFILSLLTVECNDIDEMMNVWNLVEEKIKDMDGLINKQ